MLILLSTVPSTLPTRKQFMNKTSQIYHVMFSGAVKLPCGIFHYTKTPSMWKVSTSPICSIFFIHYLRREDSNQIEGQCIHVNKARVEDNLYMSGLLMSTVWLLSEYSCLLLFGSITWFILLHQRLLWVDVQLVPYWSTSRCGATTTSPLRGSTHTTWGGS